MKTLFSSLLLIFTLFASVAQAQIKPSSNSARSVVDFYFNGQGNGVVLADIKVCMEVIDNECERPVNPAQLRVNNAYKIWLMFVVPQGESIESLSIQFFREGNLAYSKDLSVRGALRYRTWRAFTPEQPGRWEIRVFDNRGVEIETVGILETLVRG